MPDVLSDDELNVMAAEYVLGTLDHEERNGANALREVDPAFRAVLQVWEKRFGDLHLMVEAVAPDRALWDRIRPKIADIEQIPPAIPPDPRPSSPDETNIGADDASVEAADAGVAGAPDAPESPASTGEAELTLAELEAMTPVSEEPPASAGEASPGEAAAGEPAPEEPARAPAEPESPVAPVRQQEFVPPLPVLRRVPSAPPARRTGRGWMAASLLMTVIALLLTGLIGAWRFFPERLPENLRAGTVLKLPLPVPPAQPEPPPVPRPKPPAPFDE